MKRKRLRGLSRHTGPAGRKDGEDDQGRPCGGAGSRSTTISDSVRRRRLRYTLQRWAEKFKLEREGKEDNKMARREVKKAREVDQTDRDKKLRILRETREDEKKAREEENAAREAERKHGIADGIAKNAAIIITAIPNVPRADAVKMASEVYL